MTPSPHVSVWLQITKQWPKFRDRVAKTYQKKYIWQEQNLLYIKEHINYKSKPLPQVKLQIQWKTPSRCVSTPLIMYSRMLKLFINVLQSLQNLVHLHQTVGHASCRSWETPAAKNVNRTRQAVPKDGAWAPWKKSCSPLFWLTLRRQCLEPHDYVRQTKVTSNDFMQSLVLADVHGRGRGGWVLETHGFGPHGWEGRGPLGRGRDLRDGWHPVDGGRSLGGRKVGVGGWGSRTGCRWFDEALSTASLPTKLK